ncbi:hypothetical protein [Rhodococcoides navarretei]|uniref:Secreted protein n=1 Tax=Rhodococcus navarretei TaxID=3128981 RepID=A0ABU9CYK7_9NOCA
MQIDVLVAVAEVVAFATTRSFSVAVSSTVHHAELSERFVAPPAAGVDVVVAVFTFALIHRAPAAAREHLATPAALAVAPRVV